MIRVPKNVSIVSQSHAILYGLGHLFLHMRFRTDKDCWDSPKIGVYRLFNTTAQLYQANLFAHSFLMPLKEYMQAINKYSDIDNFVNIDLVAKQFQITSTDVLNRGKFLGYF